MEFSIKYTGHIRADRRPCCYIHWTDVIFTELKCDGVCYHGTGKVQEMKGDWQKGGSYYAKKIIYHDRERGGRVALLVVKSAALRNYFYGVGWESYRRLS